MDGALEWLVAEGRTDQWGTDPYPTDPRRVAAISSMAAGRDLYLAVSRDVVVGAAPPVRRRATCRPWQSRNSTFGCW